MLQLIEELDAIPEQYLKKLTSENWECRIQFGGNIFRALCFLMELKLSLLMDSKRRLQKTQITDIYKEEIYRIYDLQRYIENRKKSDSEFAKSYDSGYEEFRIGVILREARRKSGLTQEELARRIRTTKSAISRIENHAEDIKLSTIEKVAKALGKKIVVEIK